MQYEWTQTSGIQVVFHVTEDHSLQFIAPSITQEQSLQFELKVTDDHGAITTSPVNINIEPILMPSFIVSGIAVYGSPIGEITNATVLSNSITTLKIDDLIFETYTNELGEYTFTLHLDDDYLNKIMTIEVISADNNAAKLVSIVDDIQSLLALAENNNFIISNKEHCGLTVSNLSSAAAILMIQNNNGNAIQTKQQLKQQALHFSSELLLPYASLIKYLIGNYTNLPDGVIKTDFTNTYDYLITQQNTANLLADLGPYFPSLSSSRIEEDILSDIKTFLFIKDQFADKTYYTNKGIFTLNTNNTGTFTPAHASYPDIQNTIDFTWSNHNKRLSILLNQPILVSQIYINEQLSNEYITGYTLNWIFQSHYRDQLLIKTQQLYTLAADNSAFNYDSGLTIQSVKALKDTAINSNLMDAFESNAQYIISMSRPHTNMKHNALNEPVTFFADVAKLNFDLLSNQIAELEYINIDENEDLTTEKLNTLWHVNDMGTLNINSEELSIDILGFNSLDNKSMQIATVMQQAINNTTEQTAKLDHFYKIDSELTWSDNVVGVYTHKNDINALDPAKATWYELRMDGTLSYFQIIGNVNSNILPEQVYEIPGLWKLINGELILRRFNINYEKFGSTQGCHSAKWETLTSDDCVLHAELLWQQIQIQTTNTHKTKSIILDKYKSFHNKVNNNDNKPILNQVGAKLTTFFKSENRPVVLPTDYILIKDR